MEEEFYDLLGTVDSTGKEVCVLMVNVGQFPRPPLRAHTRDPKGHSQVSSARGASHLPILVTLTTDSQRNSVFTKTPIENCCFQG